MQHKQLNWAEGLFLRPHHFQAADRYWHELLGHSSEFDRGYNYGIFQVELNEDALENQILEVIRVRARTKGGTVCATDGGQVPRVDLNQRRESDPKFLEFIRQHNGIKVFLGVPQLKMSKPNVAAEGTRSPVRYLSRVQSLEDEVAGGNPQDVEVRELNLRLLFESDDLEGFETVPLCRLVQTGELDGGLKRDPQYFPPCLTVGAHAELKRSILEAAYDLLKNRSEVLRQQVVDNGTTFASQIAGAVDRLMLLRTVNEGLAGLHCYAFATGVHPFEAYTQLCQLVGRLSIFGSDRGLGEIPRYDHDNLYPIFRWALERIRSLVDLGDEGYFQRFFKGTGRARLTVNIEPEWHSKEWQLVLGIHSLDLRASDCLSMLDRAIAWKLAQPSFVDYCYEKQARGLKLRTLRNVPNVLPKAPGWSFFQITQDDLWDEVKAEGAIALRLNSDQIENLAALDQQQTVQLRAAEKSFRVEFCIFAVRVNS